MPGSGQGSNVQIESPAANLHVAIDQPISGATVHVRQTRTRGEILEAWQTNGILRKIVKSGQRTAAMAMHMLATGAEANGGYLLVELAADPELSELLGIGKGAPLVGRKALEDMGIVRQSDLGARFFHLLPSPQFKIEDAPGLFDPRVGAESTSCDSSNPRVRADDEPARTRAGALARVAESAPARVGADRDAAPLRSARGHGRASGSVRDGIKTPIRTVPEETSACAREDEPAAESGRDGFLRAEEKQSDAAFVASLTDPAALAALIQEQIAVGTIGGSDRERLRAVTAAIHAAQCQPKTRPIDVAGRRRMFWFMLYGIRRPKPETERLFIRAVNDGEEDEAVAMLKLITFGDQRSRQILGVEAESAKPARPARPQMSIDAKRANALRDWALASKWNPDGGIACNEAKRRFSWDRETYLRHLAEADAAIEAWHNWGRAESEVSHA